MFLFDGWSFATISNILCHMLVYLVEFYDLKELREWDSFMQPKMIVKGWMISVSFYV